MNKLCLVWTIAAMALFTSCEKRGTPQSAADRPPVISDSSPGGNSVAADVVVPFVPGVIVPLPADMAVPLEEAEEKPLQEIINDYASTAPGRTPVKHRLLFQIEGNFTGSGNREIIGFYTEVRWDSTGRGWIDCGYCLVCDTSGEKVEYAYPINFVTSAFMENEDDAAGAGLTEVLGRSIIWRDRKIGYVSDFNGNGKEELYLYRRGGMGEGPLFFEFGGTEFVGILDIVTTSITITGIDPEEKSFTIEANFRTDDGEGVWEKRVY
ncbi:MAG: hypothetical protein LBG57_07735, partial [Treponema sp.]|nr:hypothetical protein [Treponema sp.]